MSQYMTERPSAGFRRSKGGPLPRFSTCTRTQWPVEGKPKATRLPMYGALAPLPCFLQHCQAQEQLSLLLPSSLQMPVLQWLRHLPQRLQVCHPVTREPLPRAVSPHISTHIVCVCIVDHSTLCKTWDTQTLKKHL